jgi:hypothetical protein
MKFKILNLKRGKKKRENNQFVESSGLIPLASSPVIGTFSWCFLNVSVPSQSWYVSMAAAPLCRTV